VALAHAEYRGLAGQDRLGPDADVDALARGRAVVDYVASLTDGQAGALLDVLTGRSARLWVDAVAL
jgi:dGTPase